MKISELRSALISNPGLNIRFVLPDGSAVAPHAHVTEIARVEKRFVDCGGKLRNDALCRLQTWVSDDTDHRLTSGKMLRILEKARSLPVEDALEVDVEHEHAAGWVSQFPLAAVEPDGGELVLRLTVRHTACLAEDQCRGR